MILTLLGRIRGRPSALLDSTLRSRSRDAPKGAHYPLNSHVGWGEISAYRFADRAVCVSRGIVISKTTSRDPQFGHRKRLSNRESGKPLPRVQTKVLISNSSR